MNGEHSKQNLYIPRINRELVTFRYWGCILNGYRVCWRRKRMNAILSELPGCGADIKSDGSWEGIERIGTSEKGGFLLDSFFGRCWRRDCWGREQTKSVCVVDGSNELVVLGATDGWFAEKKGRGSHLYRDLVHCTSLLSRNLFSWVFLKGSVN